jgi:N-acetylneuraminic acid mutarotase
VLEFNGRVWSLRSSMPTPRWGAAATAHNDEVYVFGGIPKSVAECYQIANDKWNSLGSMPRPLRGQGLMAATLGSKILLFYKSHTYEYDAAKDLYTRRANAPMARTWATCAVVKVGSEDRIYVIGGYDLAHGDATNANYYYVQSSDKWSEPQPPAPYCAYGVTRDNPVWMNTIYYGFGHKNHPNLFFSAMYSYDPTNAVWSRLPTASHQRDGVACAVTGGVLYVVGGRNQPRDDLAFGLAHTEACALND